MKALLFFLVASFAGQALAQNNSPSQNAEIVTKLFMGSCMSSLGNNKAASAWAKENKLIPAKEDFSRKILRDESGEVWGLGGQFLLVLSGENHCSVWARAADASQVNKNFERLVMGVARPGLTVKPYIDKISDGAGGKYRRYGFTIQKDGESSGVMMLSTTSESSQAEVQIRLTLSLVKL